MKAAEVIKEIRNELPWLLFGNKSVKPVEKKGNELPRLLMRPVQATAIQTH